MEEIQTSKDLSSGNLSNNERKNNIVSKKNFSLRNQIHSKKNISLITFIIIVIAAVIFLVVYLPKKRKNNIIGTSEEDINYIIDRNYIIAAYQVKEGQDVKAFNPSSVGLNEDDYSFYEMEENLNTLRILKEIDKNKGHFVSQKNGLMKIKIKSYKNLTSLDYMFESCEDLINIDMSHIEASNITSMIYTFSECNKLEKINLTSINTTSVKLMDFLFAGCSNLIDIDGLETLNTSSLKKTSGMFMDCNNIISANLSSFNINKVEEQDGMFINNPNLKVVDLSNCQDANKILSHNEKFNIVIIGIDEINIDNLNGNISIQQEDEIEEINCTIGSEEKCLECSSKKGEKINCKSCNDGYYLPLGNDFTKTKCKKCDEGCNNCYANPGEDLSICVLCNDTYQLYEGKCIKNCEIGEDEKCMECFYDRCQKCNPGYYYDINYNKSICKKIDIENCIEAEMESNKLRCLKCSKGFMIYENLCFKSCDEGENEKCASCNNNFEYREYCDTCNSGYYKNFINPTKCESCFKNATYYYNNSFYYNDNYSTIFKDKLDYNNPASFLPGVNYNMEGFIAHLAPLKIQKLSNQNYSIIYLGECEDILKEKYNIKKNESIIMAKGEMYKKGLLMPIVYFKVYHPLTKEKLDLNYCKDIKMNIFLNITTRKIENNNCKQCALISGKLYCLSCKEGYILINNTCFKDCDKGCENCYFDGIKNGTCMKCKEEYLLESIDKYYSHCIPCPTGCKYCYDNIFSSDINHSYNNNDTNYNNYSDYFNYINNSSVLDHENNKYCTSCIEGYYLLNNLCKKQCDIGKEEKCLTCTDNEINRCSSCNPTYYLDIISGTCHKCQENNCLKCDNNACFKCENGYELISNKCYKTCEKGINEKCKECKNINSNNKGECASCNEGYYLPTDSTDKSKCFPCSFACLSCYGNTTTSICTFCKDNFKLSGGKCKIDIDNPSREKECPPPYVLSGEFCMEKCSIGNNDKCLSCEDEELKIDQCKECNIGYFLPTDTDKKKCEICGVYCLKCEGTKSNNNCLECQNNYILNNGRCVKNCEIGENDRCRKCLEEPGKNYRCELCNDGYYLPELDSDIYYHNSKCQKCPDNCKNCSGKYNESICITCNDGYILNKDGECIEGCAFIKVKNNCKECKDYDEDNKPDPKCTECLDGYFFPDGINKCYKCNYLGCHKCIGNITNNICEKCNDGLSPIIINNEIKSCYNSCEIGNKEKCKSCSNETNKCYNCNKGYELKNGICELIDYTLSAIYITTYENETVKLMNSYNTIVKMEVNGTIYDYPSVYFTFENPGEHKVNIRLGGYSFANLFNNIKKLKSITFWDNFDSKRINLMNDLFAYCDNLEFADLSRLNLKNNKCFMNFFKNDTKLKEVKFPIINFNNIYWFNGMFEGCESIASIDLSSAYNDKGQYFYKMFKGCKNLTKINLINFRKSTIDDYAIDLFIGLPDNGEIIINKNFYESVKKQIPSSWNARFE